MQSGFKNILNYRGASNVLTAGQRTAMPLVNGVQTQRLWVTVTGTLTITASAGPVILNRGSLLGALTFFVNENGTDVWQQDGRIAGFVTQCFAPSNVLPNLRLTSTANAAYALKERVCLFASSPIAAVPRETAFLESDPRQRFELQVLLAANGVANIASGVTATLTNVQFSIEQDYNATETALPILRPRIREQVETISGANPAYPSYIKSNNRIRGIIIQQDTTGAGEVNDIINSLAIRGDNGDLIGPQPVPMEDLAAMQQLEFGGAVYNGAAGAPTAPSPANGAYLMFHYQKFGRLKNVLFPWRDYTNFRIEFNCQPSVTAGAGTSNIRIQLLELERPAPVAGRNLVTPTLPAWLDT
jgi:hypothetical protein